jgi:transposase
LPLAFHVNVHTALTAVSTKLANTAQGLFKELGLRVPKHDTDNLARLLRAELPAEYKEVFRPLLAALEDVRKRLDAADRAMARKARKERPEAVRLAAQVPGVGLLTAVAIVVAFHDVKRFDRARDAGPYFGFDVKKRASGDRDPKLGITKAGNKTVRWLLVQCAHYILGKKCEPSALRDWGLRLLKRGGPGARGRAAVAVARKLAVLLLALLQSGKDYRPYPTAPAA